jgi:glycosyltransferase involved in cell wall biosynthesis
MRILSVSNCPALEHLGSGYVIANFAKGLRALGHEVDLVQPDEYEVCRWLRPRAISYRQAVGMLRAVKRALRLKHYDLVEFWGGEAWLATHWLIRSRSDRPMVVQHTNGPEPRYNQILRELGILKLNRLQAWHAEKLLPRAFACADGIVTVSESDRVWLAESGLSRGAKLQAIEVPLPDCFAGRPIKARATGVIGFSGTWLPKKGIGVLVPDMTQILRAFPGWRFLVLGTNSTDSVRSCFPLDIRSKVDVLPMIKDKEALAQRYEQMEIFVLPSLIESFGVALTEAMACGCATVTTRVGFGAALVDEKHVLILKKAESPYLYQAVKRLILNPELRQQLGTAAWERVQGLRWDRAVRILSDTYEGWLSEYRYTVQRLVELARSTTSSALEGCVAKAPIRLSSRATESVKSNRSPFENLGMNG